LDGTRSAVVVTGASSGIGRACALALDRAGYRVFATIRRDPDAEALRQAASERLTPVRMDVTDAASIEAAIAEVAGAVGEAGLGGLVNNAGVGVPGPIELISAETLRRQFEVNLFGPVLVTQACLPLLRRARGRIINIGSVGGRITIPFGGALCASKYALEAVNDALRMELHPFGIHVVLVAPAGIASPAADRLHLDGEAAIAGYSEEGRHLYARSFRAFLTAAVAREKKGSSPEVVARVVLEALSAPTPRTRYTVGADAVPLSLMPRLLPARWLDQVRFRLFGLPRRFGAGPGSEP
jgi:NAD(P)-dependent dehydrogenase (short-subunit alcohol dehydrogenase family)